MFFGTSSAGRDGPRRGAHQGASGTLSVTVTMLQEKVAPENSVPLKSGHCRPTCRENIDTPAAALLVPLLGTLTLDTVPPPPPLDEGLVLDS